MSSTKGRDIRRILVIQLRQIGDVLLATGLVAAIRRVCPTAYIAFAVERNAAPILENNPDLDAVIVRDPSALSDLAMMRYLSRQRFDTVVDFFRNPRTGYLTLSTRAAVRIGWDGPGKALFYNVRPRYHGKELYTVEDKSHLLQPLGISPSCAKPVLVLSASERRRADGFIRGLEGPDPLVLMAFSSPRPARRWIPERWVDLARSLGGCARIILAPGPGDEGEAERMRSAIGLPSVSVMPRGTIRDLAAVVGRCDLLVGVCSAPRHIAVALDVPSLVVAGPTKEVSWTYPSPLHRVVTANVGCRPCHRRECDSMVCMTGIRTEEVRDLAIEMLRASANRPAADE